MAWTDLLRDIPDFPKPGILFKDITPVLADGDAFADAIAAMAHGIGADVICEGVETQAQLQRLRELDVRYAQGYLIGKAAPASEVLSGEAARGPADA